MNKRLMRSYVAALMILLITAFSVADVISPAFASGADPK